MPSPRPIHDSGSPAEHAALLPRVLHVVPQPTQGQTCNPSAPTPIPGVCIAAVQALCWLYRTTQHPVHCPFYPPPRHAAGGPLPGRFVHPGSSKGSLSGWLQPHGNRRSRGWFLGCTRRRLLFLTGDAQRWPPRRLGTPNTGRCETRPTCLWAAAGGRTAARHTSPPG